MPALSARTFLASKEGEELSDCQDSTYPVPDKNLGFETCSYAVADGVATSFFSRNWAQILTGRFGESPERVFHDWPSWLEDAQGEWRLEVERAAHSENANFFVVNGLNAKRRAAATFVGLTILERNSEGWAWRAALLGDSCLFKLGRDGIVSSWNLKSSSEFSNIVAAAESRPSPNVYVPNQVGSSPHGEEPPIYDSDSLVLVTDALAKWLLKRQEAGQPVWGTILGVQTADAFQLFVDQARLEVEQPLENDDVALVILNFGEIHPIFAQQTFNPCSRPELPPVPEPPRSPDDLSVLTDTWPAITPKPDKLPSGTAKKIFSVFLALLFVGLLAGLFKTRSQLKRASEENENLRKILSAPPAQKTPDATVKSHIEELARQNEVFTRNLQNVKIRLESLPPSREGLVKPASEFPAIELPPR